MKPKKQLRSNFVYLNKAQICPWNQPVLSNKFLALENNRMDNPFDWVIASTYNKSELLTTVSCDNTIQSLMTSLNKLKPGPNFIFKDLPSVLILIIADQIPYDSMCCANKYNICLFTCIGKLEILLSTFLIIFSEICKGVPEIFERLNISLIK